MFASPGYSIKLPATFEVTGQNGYSYTETITVSSQLTGVLSGIPTNVYPLSVRIIDNCGVENITPVVGFGSLSTELPPSSLNFSCVDLGHYNIEYSFNGYYYDYTVPGTTFEVLDNGNNLVTTGYITNNIYNTVRFTNIPASLSTFKIRITRPGCTEYQEFPVNAASATGLNVKVNPIIDNRCDLGYGTFKWNITSNMQGYSSIQYRVFGTKTNGTPVNITNTNHGDIALEPGTYSWELTYQYSDASCNKTFTSEEPFVIHPPGVKPVINKIVAATCQSIDGSTLTTGIVILDYDGIGPFTIEQTESGLSNYTIDGSNVSSTTYTVENLVAGKTYNFRITDRCGNSVSQQATVKPVGPRIIERTAFQPCLNSPYTLSGVDYPTATYVWRHNGDVVSTDKTISFASFTAADAGTYTLTMTISDCIIRESSIVLTANTECNVPFNLGSIGQVVWNDLNKDGLQGIDEPLIENVEVILEAYVGPANPTSEQLTNNSYWSEYDRTSTDNEGKYLFDQLETGYYRVQFIAPLGAGFTTYQVAGLDENNTSLVNDSNAGINGYSTPLFIDTEGTDIALDNLTINAGIVQYGSVGSKIWFDANNNGALDNDETSSTIGEVNVTLSKKDDSGNWNEFATTTTIAGRYLFEQLPSGTYRVEFGLPSGYEYTLQNNAEGNINIDSNADRTTGRSEEFTIDTELPYNDSGRNKLNVDAGYIVQGALPVQLINFGVTSTEGVAHLNWSTTSEENSAKFVVLQSVNGTNWNEIGEVKATGTSFVTKQYTFTDQQPSAGINYYRLLMVDRDGTYALSNIRSAEVVSAPVHVNLYPNPAIDYIQVSVSARDQITNVEIFDISGRSVLKDAHYYQNKNISTKGLKAGSYIIKVMLSNGTTVVRHVAIVK